MTRPLRIALTKTTGARYPLYAEWLRSADPSVGIIDLESSHDPETDAAACDGLLLPGGADVDPAHYGRAHEHALCTGDAERDAREFAAIRGAMRAGVPVLGICRGLQIMTVALGGTLIVDLPAIGCGGHGKKTDGSDSLHPVHVRPGTQLAAVLGATAVTVNSAHHQSAGLLPPSLLVSAQTDDGVVEALEWSDPAGRPWMLLVQWHPERLEGGGSALAAAFLDAARSRKP